MTERPAAHLIRSEEHGVTELLEDGAVSEDRLEDLREDDAWTVEPLYRASEDGGRPEPDGGEERAECPTCRGAGSLPVDEDEVPAAMDALARDEDGVLEEMTDRDLGRVLEFRADLSERGGVPDPLTAEAARRVLLLTGESPDGDSPDPAEEAWDRGRARGWRDAVERLGPYIVAAARECVRERPDEAYHFLYYLAVEATESGAPRALERLEAEVDVPEPGDELELADDLRGALELEVADDHLTPVRCDSCGTACSWAGSDENLPRPCFRDDCDGTMRPTRSPEDASVELRVTPGEAERDGETRRTLLLCEETGVSAQGGDRPYCPHHGSDACLATYHHAERPPVPEDAGEDVLEELAGVWAGGYGRALADVGVDDPMDEERRREVGRHAARNFLRALPADLHVWDAADDDVLHLGAETRGGVRWQVAVPEGRLATQVVGRLEAALDAILLESDDDPDEDDLRTIYLGPPGSGPEGGRLWCVDDVFGGEGLEYVRAEEDREPATDEWRRIDVGRRAVEVRVPAGVSLDYRVLPEEPSGERDTRDDLLRAVGEALSWWRERDFRADVLGPLREHGEERLAEVLRGVRDGAIHDADPMRGEVAWIPEDWSPTSDAVNRLPDPLRDWIHRLETRCDPAGDVRSLEKAREDVRALRIRVEELEDELEAARSHDLEGMLGVLADVVAERGRQNDRWGLPRERTHLRPTDLSAIVAEEAGELAEAALEEEFGGSQSSEKGLDLRREAVQTAAAAVMVVQVLDVAGEGDEGAA